MDDKVVLRQATMLSDYDEITRLRDLIRSERPTKVYSASGVYLCSVHYDTNAEGMNYADIGWILPEDCCVVLEGHTHIDNATLGAPIALRVWLD